MASRWLAFVVWAVFGFSVAAWLLQMSAMPSHVPTHAVAVDTTASPRGDWTRLFGAPVVEVADAAPKADSRFKLVGLVAAPSPAATARSVALVSVDGKPPKPVRVGQPVDGDIVLLAVRARAVDLGPRGGPPSTTLEIPPLPAAATGTPPGAAGSTGTDGAAPLPQPPQAGPQPPALQPNESLPLTPSVPPMPPQAPPNAPPTGSPQS